MPGRAEKIQLFAALLALITGLLVYLSGRPPAHVYLFGGFSVDAIQNTLAIGATGQWLPSFIHPYLFILLTALAIGPGTGVLLANCLFWSSMGWLFELGQHPALSASLAARIPEWFSTIPLLENSSNFFVHGTFDPLDLVATAAGTLAAWATCLFARQNRAQP